jgi:gliding motility-associated-like protein
MRIRLWNLADSLDKQDASDTPTVETIIYWGDAGSNPTSVLGRRDTVEHVYQDSGVFQILAVGRDTKFPTPAVCRLTLFPDTATDPLTGQLMNMPIKIYVKKFKNELSPDDTIICVGNEAEFSNTSDNAFNKFVYKRFKDSDLSEIDSITRNQAPPDVVKFRFDSIGRFQIHSIPRGFDPTQIPLGAEKNCEVRDTSYISVVKPTPAFDTIRQDMNSAKYLMKNNTNASFQNSDVFEWTLYKLGESTPYVLKDGEIKGGANPKMGNLSDMDFEVDFKNDTGDFKICLKAWHIEPPADCADTVCKIISNRFLTRIKIPNVFTPNSDGSNDNFVIDIEGEDKYDLQIFNRWGNKVFESKDSKKTWNGKDMNDGGECPAGVYYFIFNYQLRAQDPATATGTVTLIK